jgi:hypothetical protein
MWSDFSLNSMVNEVGAPLEYWLDVSRLTLLGPSLINRRVLNHTKGTEPDSY